MTEVVPAVVYYIGDPDISAVKIGTTRRLVHRLYALRAVHPRAVLLATEPGGFKVERSRHYEFRSLVLPAYGREWFRKVPHIMEHVGRLRLEHDLVRTGEPVPSWMVAPLRCEGQGIPGPRPLPAGNLAVRP